MPFEPPGTKKSGSFTPNEEAVAMIISMGFNTEQAAKALKNTVGSIGFFLLCLRFFIALLLYYHWKGLKHNSVWGRQWFDIIHYHL